jgi:hypothetical protein
METIFLISVTIGGTLLLCQILLSLLGVGEHHGAGEHDLSVADHHAGEHAHEHGESWFVGILSFRTVVAALTFFGLAGLAASARDMEPPATVAIAVAAAGGVVFLLAFMMRTLQKLRADGTVRIGRAVGKPGTVYLPVPGHKSGVGKVTLNVQNRTVEYQAITPAQELAAGAKIVVVSVVNSDTLEVVPANHSENSFRA